MSDMLNYTNYYTAQAWMVTELGLTGDELTVFAILWGFSQDGETASRTPLQYFMDWIGCKSKHTIIDLLTRLEQKGLITSEKTAGQITMYKVVQKLHQCKNCTSAKIAPVVVQNLHGGSAKIAPATINNNINIKEKSNTPALAREEIKEDLTFLSWWKLYNNQITWQENECAAIWDTFAPETRTAIMRHTRRIVERDGNKKKEPKWYLRDRQWENDHPKWFAGSPAECAAHDLVQVKWNDRYLITTREQAQAYNLEIIKDWK